jgi:iron complex transport system ATP-binding protein
VQGGTLLVSLHDLRTALRFDRVLVLDRGVLVGFGEPETILTPELIHAVFRVQARKAPSLILELP